MRHVLYFRVVVTHSLISGRRLAALAATACVAALALALPTGAGAFSWQLPATTLPVGTAGASGADVAVAPDGTTTIVYAFRYSGGGVAASWIRAATRPAGQSDFVYSDVSIPYPSPGYLGGDSDPRIAISPDGTTTVVWRDGSGDQVWTATRPAGQASFPDPTQTDPQRLSDLALSSNSPGITAAGDGSVTAVWDAIDYGSSVRQVQAATRLPGQASFGARENLSVQGPIGYPPFPQIAAATDGTTTAVWSREDNTGRSTTQAAIRRPGQAGFEAPQDLSSPVMNTNTPAVAVGAEGQTTVVWNNTTSDQVEAATRQPGASSFADPEPVTPSFSLSGNEPAAQVAYSPDGKTTVVFGYGEIYSSTRPPGSSAWGTPQPLSGDSQDIYPRIAVAPDGREIVVWLAGWLTSATSIRSVTRPRDTNAWSSPETLAPNSGYYGGGPAPRLAVGANGQATAAWTANSGFVSPVLLEPRVQTVSSDATSYTVDVKTEGTGSGTVTSSPSGIDCGGTCSSSFLLSTPLVLTASASSGSSFTGWGGACSSSSSTCTVPVLGDRSVTATFTKDAPGPGPTPSNSFRISSTRSSGSSILTRLRVPGPGKLSQRATYRTRGARSSATRTACTASRTANKAGTYTLTCRLNSAARKQRRDGRLRVAVRTTFTPTGGAARSTVRTIVFRSLKPRYTG